MCLLFMASSGADFCNTDLFHLAHEFTFEGYKTLTEPTLLPIFRQMYYRTDGKVGRNYV